MVRAPLLIALLACVCSCGRLGFDAVGDGGTTGDGPADGDAGPAQTSGVFTRSQLPDGSSISAIALSPDGSTRYAYPIDGPAFRFAGGTAWTPCAYLQTSAVAVAGDGTVFASDAFEVYASTDQCTTWQPTGLGQSAITLHVVGTQLYALTATSIAVYSGGSWTTQTTPITGAAFRGFAADAAGDELIAGSIGGGMVRRVSGGSGSGVWTADSSGLGDKLVQDIAIAPSDRNIAYAVEAGGPGAVGDFVRSTDGGVTWSKWLSNGGFSVVVDPLDAQHVLAVPYDDLVVSTDGTANITAGQRGVLYPESILGLVFEPNGALLAATENGVFEATDSRALNWKPQTTGLDAWAVTSIAAGSAETYLGAYGGMLHAVGSGAFELENSGFSVNATVSATLALDAGHIFAGGRVLSLSTDGGQTWPTAFDTELPDNFEVTSLATDGSRVYAGTGTRVLYADAPYTTWTPAAIAGASHIVTGLTMTGSTLWVASYDGVFRSTNRGATFQKITIPTGLDSIASFADGTLVGGTTPGVWISDTSGMTWTQTGMTDHNVNSLLVSGTTIVAATGAGVFASSDRGATWTDVAGLDDRNPLSLAVDPNTGELLVGTGGSGLWRTAFP